LDFSQDERPRRKAEAMIKVGYEIDIICFILPNVIIGHIWENFVRELRPIRRKKNPAHM
jgi:hypothetical protein